MNSSRWQELPGKVIHIFTQFTKFWLMATHRLRSNKQKRIFPDAKRKTANEKI